MAIFTTSGSSTTQITAASSGSLWIISPDALLAVSGADAIDGTGGIGNMNFLIYGVVASDGADALDLGVFADPTTGGNTVSIASTGSVYGESSGVESSGGTLTLTNDGSIFGDTSSAVNIDDDNNSITNTGMISSASREGINLGGSSDLITNHGTISGDESAIYFGQSSVINNTGSLIGAIDGIYGAGSSQAVTNSGTITAQIDGISLLGGSAQILNTGLISTTEAIGHGIEFRSGNGNQVTNSGTVSSYNTAIEIAGSFAFVANQGSVVSFNGRGIHATSIQATISNSGEINSEADAIVSDGYLSEITNTGTIISHQGYGIRVNDHDATIVNEGTITSLSSAISALGGGAQVTNSGQISNANTSSAAIALTDGENHFLNSGEVLGSGTGVFISGTNNLITNNGTITADLEIDGREAILVFSTSSDTNEIVNNGFLIGNIETAVISYDPDIPTTDGEGIEIVENNGLIDGDLSLDGGDDIYFGELGMMTYGSEIHLGGGDDALYGGEGRERVYDGGGDDTVEGGAGNDSFRAGTGANDYDGGDGIDYLSYYDFATAVRINLTDGTTTGGGAGNAAGNDIILNIESLGGTNGGGDVLIGDEGRNGLYGWGGDDALSGRDGDDVLNGGSGEDFLDGGNGTDQLYGGADADTFEFDAGEGDDVIHDFENNIDLINFDNFGYLSTAADALTYATQTGSDVFFDFGADGSLLVLGVTTGQLANDIAIV